MFTQSEIAFLPGLYANRSRRGSKQRWVDGDLVRFTDGVPSQIGGWEQRETTGAAIVGSARGSIAWRPNDQNGRFAVFGSEAGAYLYDGGHIDDITPTGFVPGSDATVVGDGFGSDVFGVGTFGTPRDETDNLLEVSNWTFDMFGEVLIACFSTDGLIYSFHEGDDTRLTLIDEAPTAQAILVSDERHVFAFGSNGLPGQVSWSDRENPAVWEPLETNRAGSYDLQVTSRFQCGRRVRGLVLGWTQTEVFAFTPLNNALVYSKDKISSHAGAAGPNAVVVVTDPSGESAYWIGRNNFFIFEGYVRVLDCDLHDYVFGTPENPALNLMQASKFHARLNVAADEVWFWYCSYGSQEIDRAVIYNFKLGVWSKASVARLTWIDAGVFQKPMAIGVDGNLYDHEIGDTADGVPMPSFVLSHPITVGVGQQFAEVDQFWPDMQPDSAPCTVSFVCRDAPGGDAYLIGPLPFAVADEIVPLNIATREFQLRIGGAGGRWELGVPLISMQGGSLR